MIGKTISHYRITRQLGGGGMGVVYEAEDTRLDRSVALKFLPPELTEDADAKERFSTEARAAAALDHANICTVYDIGEADDGRMFLALAYYDGETLKKKIERGLPKAEAARESGGDVNRAWNMALLYARVGEMDQAFYWLEEAVGQRGGLVVYAGVHHWLDSLRDDPRFDDVLRRLNLAG